MSPKPRTRNATEETANTAKFLKRMLTQFLARQKPDSTRPKPRFMKKTRNAASITQMVSMAIFWLAMASAISFVKAGAGVAGAAWAGADAGAAAAGAAGGGGGGGVVRAGGAGRGAGGGGAGGGGAPRHEAEERVWYSRTVYGKLMSSCMVTVFSPPVLFSL